MPPALTSAISLTSGFSPVAKRNGCISRFNGFFFFDPEAAEAAGPIDFLRITGLKPGANHEAISPGDSARALHIAPPRSNRL
jgi:hypothetical protein